MLVIDESLTSFTGLNHFYTQNFQIFEDYQVIYVVIYERSFLYDAMD